VALSEFERKRLEKVVGEYVESRRPTPQIRRELDLGFRVEGQSVEIFELRPAWRDPSQTLEESVAKATFVRRTGIWRIYWQRADLKWHRYDPHPETESIEEFLRVVERDDYGCFFG